MADKELWQRLEASGCEFTLAELYEELTALRESGEINMMGAPHWLAENFELPTELATEVFWAWVDEF